MVESELQLALLGLAARARRVRYADAGLCRLESIHKHGHEQCGVQANATAGKGAGAASAAKKKAAKSAKAVDESEDEGFEDVDM